MRPAKNFYKAQQQPSTEVDIYHGLLEDVYLTFGAYNENTKEASLRINLNPLVSYLWLGGMITLMGSFLILIPRWVAQPLLEEGA
jgi:cytochrome c-type biogenesis protein CcmF